MGHSIFEFIVVGFLAQLIDGALGMAYGVSSNTFLLSLGVPPAVASASVHAAEIFTTGVSGYSHWRLGNTDKALIKRLVIPGVLGGVIGAYLLTAMPTQLIKPVVAVYLGVMGVVILLRAMRPIVEREVRTAIAPLGMIGGFFDAIGGGGWGPIVTSTLMARGNNPRLTIGSVNVTEFFVTLSQSIVFILTLTLTLENTQIVLGLLIGGVLAAPLAAFAARYIPARPLMMTVGVLIIILSVRTLILAIG
jgi:uncharacterized membrane protein YfcA